MSTTDAIAAILRDHGRSHAVGYGEKYACACGAPLPTNSRKSIANHQAQQVAALVKTAEAHAETLRAALGALRGLASSTHSSFDDTYAIPGAKLRQIIMDAENATKGES